MSDWQQKWQAWREMTIAMQDEIKVEAAEKVKAHLLASEFEQAIQVIKETETLTAELDLTKKWEQLEQKLTAFSNATKPTAPFQADQLSQLEERRHEKTTTFSAATLKEEAKQQFTARDFNFVGETNGYLHFVKASRNYYLDLYQPDKEKNALLADLEAMRQYKNIGWICRNQSEALAAKELVAEWLETLDTAKKKFLTMNIASLAAMKDDPSITFQ